MCVFRQCRKEMEDFICCLVQKRLEECRSDPEGSALHVKPQVRLHCPWTSLTAVFISALRHTLLFVFTAFRFRYGGELQSEDLQWLHTREECLQCEFCTPSQHTLFWRAYNPPQTKPALPVLGLKVIGSVLYFTSFCVDKLGQPLLNESPQLTDGWEVPKYPKH